jgi:hypothetical protein
MNILGVVPLLVALPMVVPPSFFLLFSILKPIFDDNLMCIVVTGSKLSLVEFGGSLPLHTLLEVCSAHFDKVEIKCLGSVGGKTPTEPKLYVFFSSLRHIES